MNLDDISTETLKNLVAHREEAENQDNSNPYVIVRCRDAGVHAGYLMSKEGRSCVLEDSRRLWYWKPANGAVFLSGVAIEGLDSSSKVGTRVSIELTENCEIIKCTLKARDSINSLKDYRP